MINLCARLILTFQEIVRHCASITNRCVLLFGLFLLMSLEGLFHLHLLGEPLTVVDFRLDASQFLGLIGRFVHLSGLLLSLTFLIIEATTETLLMKLNVLVLWHGCLLESLLG
ncbi:hypothetical protein TYRP_001254 [Tyrophagus putrescentiae]|nr:hypothetical protein TYRP_001254 [Tyrophagus putrescentiae]